MEAIMEMIEVVERLGALGILTVLAFFGVRWMGRRLDRMLDHNERLIALNGEAVAGFKDAVLQFQRFEQEERLNHEKILASLSALEGKLERLPKLDD